VTFSWNVQNASAVYFYAQGQPWQDNEVPPITSRVVYPPQTTIYELRVVSPANTVEVRQIRIDVQAPPPDAPVITRFTLSPSDQVSLGGCVNLQWTVEGTVDSVQLLRSGQSIWNNAPFNGAHQDCPSQPGEVVYGILASGPGSQAQQNHSIDVFRLRDPRTDHAADGPSQQLIRSRLTDNYRSQQLFHHFLGRRRSKRATPATARNGQLIYEGSDFTVKGQDCLNEPGDYVYNLVAYNYSGQSVSQEAVGTVRAARIPDPIVGIPWRLADYLGSDGGIIPAPQDGDITLLFQEDGNLSGVAGCNQYSAAYKIQNPSLMIGEISSTEMYCSEPPGIMELESRYLELLQQSQTVQLSGSQLTLFGPNAEPFLVFDMGPQPR
jgi:heat shock protein HslJ